MTIIELFIITLVGSIFLWFFVTFFWRTGKVHQQQTLEMFYQRTFAKLCDQLEKDLSGCLDLSIQPMIGYTSLQVNRIGSETFLYTANLETGLISRESKDHFINFEFKGERKGVLKRVDFIKDADNPNGLRLKIELKTVPPIELSQDLSVRISADIVNNGFFENPKLDERKASAAIGIGH